MLRRNLRLAVPLLFSGGGIVSTPLSNPESGHLVTDAQTSDTRSTLTSKTAAVIDIYYGYGYHRSIASYSDLITDLNTMATAFSTTAFTTADSKAAYVSNLNELIAATNPVLIVDFDASIYYWDGASKTIGDLTDNGDGSYTLNYGGWWVDTHTAIVEYSQADGVVPSGNVFSWTNASNQRFEVEPSVSSTAIPQVYFNPPGAFGSSNTTGGINNTEFAGNLRMLIGMKPSNEPVIKYNATVEDTATTGGSTIGVFVAPTELGFGYRARFDDFLLTDATLRRVVIYDRELTTAQRHAANVRGSHPPVHLLGDSFLNTGSLLEQINLLCTSSYIAMSQDGAGGSTLTQQATRFDADTLHQTSTLIIIDGGFDYTEDYITAINNMIADLDNHNNWFYVQPNPVNADGTSARDDFDAAQADILSTYGASHYIETLTGLQAEATLPGDQSDLDDNIWPSSLRSDATHLNAAGEAVYAQIIYDHVSAKGFMP